MEKKRYIYQAKFLEDPRSIYDADTVKMNIDLGLGIWVKNQKARLFGINAPEMRGEEKAAGTVSRDYVREHLLNKECVIETIKDRTGKYGRWLIVIWLDGKNFNKHLVEAGFAKEKFYGSKKPDWW